MFASRSKVFSLTPSYHWTNDVLGFNSKDDINYYLRVEEPLFLSAKTNFNALLITSTFFYKLWMRDYRNIDGITMAQ